MRKSVAILIIFIMMMSALPLLGSGSDAVPSENDFLIDYGNGKTDWVRTNPSSTIKETVQATISASGVQCSFSGTVLTVNDLTTTSIGGPNTGGTTYSPGTTGLIVTSIWHVFSWNDVAKEWEEVADIDSAYSSQKLAVGFYPDDVVPVETPDYKTSWTMIEKDAENSANQTAELPTEEGSFTWTHMDEKVNGCYSAILYARGYVFVKYGNLTEDKMATVVCYDAETGEQVWSFKNRNMMYDTVTSLIVGDYIYIQSTARYVFKFDWRLGPGVDNCNVTTFDGASMATGTPLPLGTGELIEGNPYGEGLTSLVFDSGTIIFRAYGGMVYCYNLDLQLIWSYQMKGKTYFTAATVKDDYVATGAYDGRLYILDKHDGTLVTKTVVYRQDAPIPKNVKGCVNTPIMIEDTGGYKLFVTYGDGNGMNTIVSGIAVYSFNGTELNLIRDIKSDDVGGTPSYLTRYISDDFKGVVMASYRGIYTIDSEGDLELINDVVAYTNVTHATPTLVNNELMFVNTYSGLDRYVFTVNTKGETIGMVERSTDNFSMTPVTVVDGMFFTGDDSGMFGFAGTIPIYVPPVIKNPMELWMILAIILGVILGILLILWCILRFIFKWDRPYDELRNRVMNYFFGENYTHNTRSKRKLYFILIVGALMTLTVAVVSLCVGSETTLSLSEGLSATFSSIQKHGHHLSYEEILVYNQRLPRIIAAFAVGIGLSVAGAMYQAVIKNPLVEPYIMGVSSGAGTFALAVLTFNFTFFGLFAPKSPGLIAFAAIFGGLLAFSLTMMLAEKTGGKTINYVLGGIIIGLVFSAIQSLMMIQAGNKITSALSWLYGSFTSITWDTVWITLIPCLALSMVPLIWAKEFNLVLLGEDQAQQMGLNARKFDRIMLITASILTAFCVAFCGIIGFVGLVIPHISRMILGGDHRLMLPTSMAFGGFLMILADLLSRTLLTGFELPVGAITTIIGVPMFAYLLIKRGKSYES